MPKRQDATAFQGRRDFLCSTLAVSAGMATAALASGSVAAAPAATPVEKEVNNTGQGYRVTQHILDYYKSAAF